MTGGNEGNRPGRLGARAILAGILVATWGFQNGLQAQDRANGEEKRASQESQLEAPAEKPAQSGEDVLGVAAEMGQYSTFLELVEEAELEDDIQAGGPFTIFMPTDAALAALPAGQLEALRKDGDELRRLIRTHMAMGEWTIEELTGANRIENLLGAELPLEGEMELEAPRNPAGADGAGENMRPDDEQPGAGLRIANARVIEPDHQADNGVIHGIDSVLQAPGTADVAGAESEDKDEQGAPVTGSSGARDK